MTASSAKPGQVSAGPRVSIRQVEKSFGGTKVLKGVDLEINSGEFLILLGPSGCGKTTLLRIIAGLEKANRGEIWLGGLEVSALEPKERNVAMVFQNYALYPHMNVYDNQAFSLRLRGMSNDRIKGRVEDAAAILGLQTLQDRFPRQLSGGQRQRVSMGRAIVRSPGIFLFDEPLSNLDAKLRVHMRGEIKDLHHRLGTTSIYVTHDQVEAMTMGDRIVVMNQGVIEQIGHPVDVFDKPKNLFVAGFVGSPAMNLLTGSMGMEGNHAVVRCSDEFSLQMPKTAAKYDGRAVTLGIRPHQLGIDVRGGFEAEIRDIQPTGVETILL